MGMYDTFETDTDLENTGVWIDYGEFRVRIASASQSNTKYVKFAEKALKPLRKAIQAGALSRKRDQEVMMDIYAKTIVIDWETINPETGEPETGIENKDGDIIPFNEENVKTTFKNLPNLFVDIQEQANTISNFRHADLENDSGN